MPYARITILLRDGSRRSGVRKFPSPMNLADIRTHAWRLSAEVLGRGSIEDVTVTELPADDPGVVALLLGQQRRKQPGNPDDGSHADLVRRRTGRR